MGEVWACIKSPLFYIRVGFLKLGSFHSFLWITMFLAFFIHILKRASTIFFFFYDIQQNTNVINGINDSPLFPYRPCWWHHAGRFSDTVCTSFHLPVNLLELWSAAPPDNYLMTRKSPPPLAVLRRGNTSRTSQVRSGSRVHLDYLQLHAGVVTILIVFTDC